MTLPLPVNPEMAATFTQLAEVVYTQDSGDAIHTAIVDAAVRLVGGCDRASLLLAREGTFRTAAATDEIAQAIDQLEQRVGEGPCIDAIQEESFQFAPDIAAESPWPTLTPLVLEHTPVRGMIGYRLMLEGTKAGALNLFADEAGAFTKASADDGAVLAAFASVTLMALAARQTAAELRAGLESNREIGKAIGMLMATHGVSSDEAFSLLKAASQRLNVKVAAVARRLAEEPPARTPDIASSSPGQPPSPAPKPQRPTARNGRTASG